jgi:uncharacterized membrane protein YhaH (DUF805 family)
MSFTEAIRAVLSNYAIIAGRAARPEFWWWILFVGLLYIATGLVDGVLIAPALGFKPFEELAGHPLSPLATLAIFVPGLCVGVRRLHDIDRSGWWFFITLIPLIGVLVLIYWWAQPGTKGNNRFGAAVT